MRKLQMLAAAALLLNGILSAQDNSTRTNFAGTWQANFKGAVFCTLKIEPGSAISSSLSPRKISVNDDGKTLSFEWKESGAKEAVKFEAEMRFVGVDGIKPIRLRPATAPRP